MRATAATTYRDSLADLERVSERLADFQRQISSGRRISRPSDDPGGTATAIAERGELGGVEQYTRTADSATSRLTVADSALTDIVDRLSQAQVSVVSAQGSGKTAGEREVAATTLESVRDALAAALNTSFQGVYLFAGADSTSPPYVVGPGGTVSPYQGSTQEVQTDIDRTRTALVGLDGSTISQGGAATDVFTVLTTAAAAARAGDETGLQQALVDLRAAFDRASDAQVRVGTNLSAIDEQQTHLVDRRLAALGRVAKVEDTNMAEAMAGMNQADTAYRASLGAAAQIGRRSLMDYLS
jgi:flagellar hook-associated protein 3 FlgL